MVFTGLSAGFQLASQQAQLADSPLYTPSRTKAWLKSGDLSQALSRLAKWKAAFTLHYYESIPIARQ
jgi:hypothetical protein